MSRLTKKVSCLGKQLYCSQRGDFYDLYNKLGELEDLEEQLGCPLDVVFKAIKQGKVYINEAYNCGAGEVYKELDMIVATYDLSIQFTDTDVDKIEDYFSAFANQWCWQFQYNIDQDDCSWDWYLIKLSDYKKTWWLKEDKSE